VPDALFRIDRHGTYLDFKPGRDFEPYRPVPEFLGKKVTDVLPPDVAALCMENIQRTLADNSLVILEYRLPLPGGPRQFEARLLPTGPEEVVAIVRDISEQRLAEERLRRREAELAHVLRRATMGEMATELAHELTQPLSAITSYAAACANEVRAWSPTGAGLLPKLEAISAQALSAGKLIHRIRTFLSRGAAQRSRVALNDLVNDVLALSTL